jgi:hypothetical protein
MSHLQDQTEMLITSGLSICYSTGLHLVHNSETMLYWSILLHVTCLFMSLIPAVLRARCLSRETSFNFKSFPTSHCMSPPNIGHHQVFNKICMFVKI